MIRTCSIALILFLQLCISLKAQTVILDTSFKNFLKEAYPQVLDAQDNLILSEASAVQGNFVANNRQIRSAEGIQYFTGITLLDLSDNELDTLPDLSNITGLRRLILTRNKLSNIDFVRNTTSLTHLFVSFNQLVEIGDISSLTGLISLYATNNFITRFPDLNNNLNLEHLHLSNNRISQINELPSFNNLRTFELSYNQLEKFPDLSRFTSLRDIYLNNNLIDTYASSQIPRANLRRLRIEKNNLSMAQLLTLSEISNFGQLVTYAPQNVNVRPYTIQFKTGQSFAFKSPNDSALTDATYSWYRNGVPFWNSEVLSWSNVQPHLSGDYFCIVTHPSLPSLEITTFHLRLEIMPCVSSNGYELKLQNETCSSKGLLEIKLDEPSKAQFELTSVNTSLVYTNSTGVFEHLPSGKYTVKISINDCYTELNEQIEIANESCKEIYLTPNSDGQNESYYFFETGSLKVFDKNGLLVSEFSCPGEWKPFFNGRLLPVGYYSAVLNETDKFGITIFY